MNDLQALLQELPQWAQALVLLAVVGLGVLAGTKQTKKRGKRPQQPSKGGRPPRAAGTVQSRDRAVETSPGQDGRSATRDLTAAEVRTLHIEYSPSLDGSPDPGEVVWTWVPYAEHDGRGKDRPVLIIARIDGGAVAGCYLSTKQHRNFIAVGPGDWDSQGRPSYLNPERVLRVANAGMRREGAVLSKARFTQATQELVAWYRA